MPLSSMLRNRLRSESGIGLIEALVALSILGLVALTFLSGLYTTSKAAFITDTRSTALSMAQSQMEWAENYTYFSAPYDYTSASPNATGKDYINYSANITATSINGTGVDIQKITVIVMRSGAEVTRLESYKANR